MGFQVHGQVIVHQMLTICVCAACVCANVFLPTDRRVGLLSRLAPWLRGIRLRRWGPVPMLRGAVLSMLRAVLLSTRPGEPERDPAADEKNTSVCI